MNKWRAWFSYAVLRLGLSPRDFWALSFTEWRWLLTAAAPAVDALDAQGLQTLLSNYPDNSHDRYTENTK